MISLLWQIWYIIGIIFIVANGQILKNDLTIWSHWTMNPIATRIQTDPKKLASSTRGGGRRRGKAATRSVGWTREYRPDKTSERRSDVRTAATDNGDGMTAEGMGGAPNRGVILSKF